MSLKGPFQIRFWLSFWFYTAYRQISSLFRGGGWIGRLLHGPWSLPGSCGGWRGLLSSCCICPVRVSSLTGPCCWPDTFSLLVFGIQKSFSIWIHGASDDTIERPGWSCLMTRYINKTQGTGFKTQDVREIEALRWYDI